MRGAAGGCPNQGAVERCGPNYGSLPMVQREVLSEGWCFGGCYRMVLWGDIVRDVWGGCHREG